MKTEAERKHNDNFVHTMAELGEKHAKLISETLETVAEEVRQQITDELVKDIHPVFMAAGKGAYHGAMKIMMEKNNINFGILQFKNDD